ncbi:hypothetical protein [Novispirillum itersonii]|uniref:Uncharacterized protein n=1 Tax=Novispirillum itersonii TaxID=189 RepID=A0A7X0DMN7_NOVIT|nr:hypothetical protein [Novispirillum itersonii]MBB6211246.1 hypothetical protein [Novispirillum itersonii]
MRRFLPSLSVFLPVLCLALPQAQAETPLSGTYTVQGIAANGSVSYAGKTTVIQTGQTYRVEWSLSGGREQYVGTGIRSGDTFAVVYTAPQNAPNAAVKAPGLVVYTIQPNGSLTGYYTTHGAKTVSAEAWNPTRF